MIVGYIIYLIIFLILILRYVIFCCLILSWFKRRTWGNKSCENGTVRNREAVQWVKAGNWNHKVASSKPYRSSIRIRDLTSLQGFNWPVGRKLNKCSDLGQRPKGLSQWQFTKFEHGDTKERSKKDEVIDRNLTKFRKNKLLIECNVIFVIHIFIIFIYLLS